MKHEFWNVAVCGSRSLLIVGCLYLPILLSCSLLADESGGKTNPQTGKNSEGTLLRYRWEPNRDYYYQLSVTAKLDDVEFSTRGFCNLRVDPQGRSATEQSKSSATGTAFVVAPDGYLVTAAHVIDGATSIKITLNSNTYQGTVIGSDAEKDLAIIKIDAEKLPTLPFADSEQVGLGQSIWALGYPLLDVLGSSLKINSGMVSGVNQTQDGKIFQLNATLNPGNSGGPILNETGNVIAVAIQRVAGRDITDVGLTRPINDTRDLMVTHGLTVPSGSKQKRKMDGQAIVNASQKSIAFVEVEMDPMRDATKLIFNGSLTTDKSNRSSRGGFSALTYPSFQPPKHRTPKGSFVLSPFGALSDMIEDDELPFALGYTSEFLLEPFDSAGRKEWSHERKSTVATVEPEEKKSPFDPPSSIRPPLGFFESPSRKENKKIKLYDIIENEKFKILKHEGDKTHVEKYVDLKSTDDSKRPFLELSGKGEWVFNHKEGCLESATTKYDFLLQVSPSVSVRVPIEVKINYVDPATVATNAKRAEEQRAFYEAENRKKKALEYDQMSSGVKVKRLQKFEIEGHHSVQGLRLSSDGMLTAVATSDNKIRLFNRTKPESTKQLEGLPSSPRMMEFSPDSQFLIASSFSEGRAWNLQTGETFSLSSQRGSFSDDAVFSADSRYVYLGSSSEGIEKIELKTGVRGRLHKDDSRMEAMTISLDGKTLILTDHRKEIIHWSLESSQAMKTVSLKRTASENVHYQFAVLSPSGLGLFGSFDHIDVLKLEDASKLMELPVRSLSKEGLAFSRNGRVAAIASHSDKTVLLWDVANNKRIEEIKADTVSAKAVALSADGHYVATVGYDRVVQVWENISQ